MVVQGSQLGETGCCKFFSGFGVEAQPNANPLKRRFFPQTDCASLVRTLPRTFLSEHERHLGDPFKEILKQRLQVLAGPLLLDSVGFY